MAIAVPVSWPDRRRRPAAAATATLPCDIYAAGGTPCVAAQSTTRALFASYNGPLYQIQRASDGSTLNISVAVGGRRRRRRAAGLVLRRHDVHDHEDLRPDREPQRPADLLRRLLEGPRAQRGGHRRQRDGPAGHGGRSTVYGVKVTSGTGYRTDAAVNVPTGSQPIGVYMVTSSSDVNQYCCFDYGLGETKNSDDGNATMNAIYWGTACWLGGCTGSGPWVEADLENGMYSSSTGPNTSSNLGVNFPFVSAWEKNNGTSNFTLKYGNADSGALTTTYSGALPNGYSPMKLQPASCSAPAATTATATSGSSSKARSPRATLPTPPRTPSRPASPQPATEQPPDRTTGPIVSGD